MNEHSVFKNTTEKVVFDIQRHPQRGPHPVWYVFINSTLLCACAYRKGAQALIQFLDQFLDQFLIKEIQQ